MSHSKDKELVKLRPRRDRDSRWFKSVNNFMTNQFTCAKKVSKFQYLELILASTDQDSTTVVDILSKDYVNISKTKT